MLFNGAFSVMFRIFYDFLWFLKDLHLASRSPKSTNPFTFLQWLMKLHCKIVKWMEICCTFLCVRVLWSRKDRLKRCRSHARKVSLWVQRTRKIGKNEGDWQFWEILWPFLTIRGTWIQGFSSQRNTLVRLLRSMVPGKRSIAPIVLTRLLGWRMAPQAKRVTHRSSARKKHIGTNLMTSLNR